MKALPKYYTTLFNSVSEAIESMEAQNFGTAKRILLRGQYEAEGLYIAETEVDRMEEERKEEAGKKREPEKRKEPAAG